MSEKKEQVKPLAPAAHRLDIEETNAFSVEFRARRHGRCIKCCGCSIAILLIIATVILVLMFTVLHVKDPVVKMNSVKIEGLEYLLKRSSTNFRPGRNLTFEADFSIKNPNVASFRFNNTTMDIYCNRSIIGGIRSLSGEARARRTLRKKFSIELVMDKILDVGRLESDLDRGILPISSSMRMSGKVKITNVIKRNVAVKMNCTMNVNISSGSQQGIQDLNCRRVSL